jgi:hypothetical protein
VARGAALGVPGLRTDEIFTSPFPCLSWPYQPPDGTRPAPLTAPPYPVFVLASTGDPITPIARARAIAGRLADGYLVETQGGPHVTFGRQSPCVDRPVVDFLLEGRRPKTRSIGCAGSLAEPYIPLTAATAAGYRDALDAMDAARDELFADPAYRVESGGDEIRVGCRNGGFIAITRATFQDNIRFADCAWVEVLPLTGLGSYVYETGTVSWSVTAPDGELEYVATGTDSHVTGTWRGRSVDITR